MRTIWQILFLLFVTATGALAQSFVLGDLDASAYPTIRARFYLFDAAGNRITSLSPSDFIVTEDGVRRDVTELRFCTAMQPRPLTVGIMVDTKYYIDLARAGTSRLIDFLPMPTSELGITTMDQGVFIVQDLTKKKDRALEKAGTLQPAPGVDINRMFYDPLAGGVPFVSGRPNKKVLVLISDLHCPNLNIDEEKLYADAAREDISIYAVLLNANDYTGLFKRMADRTGGKVFERVRTEEQIENIFRQIGMEQITEPCELVWQSSSTCSPSRSATIEIPSLGLMQENPYSLPADKISSLQITLPILYFGAVPPGSSKEITITITAMNATYIINEITSSEPRYTVADYGGSPPAFTLQPGESRTIRVRYDPTDSAFVFGQFIVKTNLCDATITCSGGYPGKRPQVSTLKLLHPNGGETFTVGLDTVITWKGVPADMPVVLDYSTNAGATWMPITKNATGLRYNWNVPNTPSDRCLARVSQVDGSSTERDLFIIDSVEPIGAHAAIAFSPDGWRVAVPAIDGTVEIWDVIGKQRIVKLSGLEGDPHDVVWNPDGRMIAAGSGGNSAAIWDATTGALLHSLTGHGGAVLDIAWSPDGDRIATACSDATVRVWTLSAGGTVITGTGTFTGHASDVTSLSWKPDGTAIVTASNDGKVRIWDLGPAGQHRTFAGHPLQGLGVAWSPTMRHIASTGYYGDCILWDAVSGSKVWERSLGQRMLTVEWSPDGSMFATASFDGMVRIWDTISANPVHQFVIAQLALSARWSPDGTKLLTTGTGGAAILWDVVTGAVIETIDGHANNVRYCAWSPDGIRFGTIELGGTARIITVAATVLQSDVSDTLWSIVAPRFDLNVTDVDMHTVQLGGMRDSLVTAVLCNRGAAPLHVLGMDVTTGDVSDFMIPSGAGDFTLAPGECRDVTFEFMPTAIGLRQARVTLRTASGNYPDTIRVYGVGASPQMEVVSTVIDFKQVEVGAEKDTTVTVVLRNIGASPVNVNSVTQRGPDMTQFEIISGGDPFTLAAGEEHAMTLRFKPRFIGRTSGRIAFEHDAVGSPSIATLFGEGIGGMVYIPDDSAAAGERLKLRLMLGGRSGKVQGTAREFSAVIGVDQSLLASDDPATPGTIAEGRRKIAVSGEWDGRSEVLAELPVIALLGSTETSSMDVLSFEWRKSDDELFDVDVDTESGKFRLLDICREGGDRLYDQNGVASALKVLPNSVRDRAEIRYSLAEDGIVTIEVYDMLGERVERLLSEEQQAGEYRMEIETSDISSGIYTIVLRTPTQLVSAPLHVDR